MVQQQEHDNERIGAGGMAYMVAIAVFAPALFLLLPAVIGALFEELKWTETQLGLFATVELLGIAIAAASGMYWVTRWRWLPIARVALLVILLTNLLTWQQLGEIQFSALLAVRFATGAAAGLLMAMVYYYVAHHPATERVAGFMVSVQVAIQVSGLYLLPQLIQSSAFGGLFHGSSGIFLIIAVVAAVLLVTSGSLPDVARRDVVEATARPAAVRRTPAIIVLFSFSLFFIVQTSLWGFLELIGNDFGLQGDQAILAISLSTAIGITGALIPSVVGDRFGQRLPLAAAAIMQLGALIMLGSMSMGFVLFLAVLALFQIGWNMAIPYHLGVIADIDPTHRYIVLTPTAQAIGVSIGPVTGGILIEQSGYSALYTVAGVVCLLYCAAILPFARK